MPLFASIVISHRKAIALDGKMKFISEVVVVFLHENIQNGVTLWSHDHTRDQHIHRFLYTQTDDVRTMFTHRKTQPHGLDRIRPHKIRPQSYPGHKGRLRPQSYSGQNGLIHIFYLSLHNVTYITILINLLLISCLQGYVIIQRFTMVHIYNA